MYRALIAVTGIVVGILASPASVRAQTVAIPANAHATADGWECNRGFRSTGNACEAVRVPPDAQIDTAGHGWECNRGFKQVGDGCERLVIPANARLDTLGHDWVCNRGYRADGDRCVAIAGSAAPSVQPARPANAPASPLPAARAPRSTQRGNQPPPLPPRAPEQTPPSPSTIDSRNWTACGEAIETLKTATDEAQEQVSTTDAAREEYQSCRENGGTCSTERREFETARTEATRLLNAMRTAFRAAASACGITP